MQIEVLMSKAFFLVCICISLVFAQTNNLFLRIGVQKDTIIIGEPIIIKCTLVNKGNADTKIWSAMFDGLLTNRCMAFSLYTPANNHHYNYNVFTYANTLKVPDFILPMRDSVYFYAMLCWAGELGGFANNDDTLTDPLTYSELEPGTYKISASYQLPGLQVSSNLDSFVGAYMSNEEIGLYLYVGSIINNFFGWPYNFNNEDLDTIVNQLQKYVEKEAHRDYIGHDTATAYIPPYKENSIFTQYCLYILAYCSPRSTRIQNCHTFLRKYPDGPLSEQLTFWNARAHFDIKQKSHAMEYLWRLQVKYPDNITGFLYLNKNRKEPIPIAIGLTIKDMTSLRTEPDSTAEIVKSLEFGVPFLIYESRSFREGSREWHWFRVALMDKETKGWIISKEGRDCTLKAVDLENNDFAGLYYDVATHEMWGYHEYEIAERLFQFLLNTYGNKKIPIIEPILGDVKYVHANMAVLQRLATLHSEKKDFGKALGYYEKRLAQKEATKEDTISTKFGMMRMYLDAMKANEKINEAIRFYHHIIKDFKDAKLEGYEGHVWLDIEAVEYICRALLEISKDTIRLENECRKVMYETTNPAVYLIATEGLMISQLSHDSTESALLTLSKAVNKYPDEIREYFKSETNYTIELIKESLYNAVRFQENSDKLSSFVDGLNGTLEKYKIILNKKERVFTILYYDEPSKEPRKYEYKYLHILYEKLK